MIEEPDVDKRRELLAGLVGIEDRVWVTVEGHERVYAVADEDLDRDTEEKTSSVHFLRFEISPAMVRDVKAGAVTLFWHRPFELHAPGGACHGERSRRAACRPCVSRCNTYQAPDIAKMR